MAVIKLWSIMENAISSLIAEQIASDPSCINDSVLTALKGPLLEFVRLGPSEQAAFLARELSESVGAKLKLGIGRFESVLSPVGLGGNAPDEVRRSLLELQQVRHIFVHNSGFTDIRFTERCPWLNLECGERFRIERGRFHSYWLAAFWYLSEIKHRLLVVSDQPTADRLQPVAERLLESLKKLVANDCADLAKAST